MALPITAMDKSGVVAITLDASKVDMRAASAIPVLAIPPGQVVTGYFAEVVSAESSTGAVTAAIGFNDVTELMAAVNLKETGYAAAAGSLMPTTAYGYLLLSVSRDLDDAVIRVSVAMTNMTSDTYPAPSWPNPLGSPGVDE